MQICNAIDAFYGQLNGWEQLQAVKSGRPSPQQWTVLAALSYTEPDDKEGEGTLVVVGTGSRSINIGQLSCPTETDAVTLAYLNGDPLRGQPYVVSDMHAEIIVIRRLRRVYLDEYDRIMSLLVQWNSSVEITSWLYHIELAPKMKLTPKPLQWHLSISLPPCGQLTDEARKDLGSNRTSGAKRFHPSCAATDCHVRYKPGRMDGDPLTPSTSMIKRSTLSYSCSDKLAVYCGYNVNLKGAALSDKQVQGCWMGSSLLAAIGVDNDDVLPPPLTVSYIDEGTVYKLHWETGLTKNERGLEIELPQEFNKTDESKPTPGVCFVASNTPTGGVVHEAIHMETGLLRSYTPKRPRYEVDRSSSCRAQFRLVNGSDPLLGCSLLSRYKMVQLISSIIEKQVELGMRPPLPVGYTYREFKRSSSVCQRYLLMKTTQLSKRLQCCPNIARHVLLKLNHGDESMLPTERGTNPRLDYVLQSKITTVTYNWPMKPYHSKRLIAYMVEDTVATDCEVKRKRPCQ